MKHSWFRLIYILPMTAGIGFLLYLMLTAGGLKEQHSIIVSFLYFMLHSMNTLEIDTMRDEIIELKYKVK